MDANVLRKLCAQEAMNYIKDGYIIGLGAGRTIETLISYLMEQVSKGLKVKVVTPSYNTKKLCVDNGIDVVETYFINQVDVAFDGCGEVDKDLYASKGGGGVFTKEKLIAAMAKEYILLIDESKFSYRLSYNYPISLEVLKDSLSYVIKSVENLGGKTSIRSSNIKDGYTITDDGNFLLDIQFNEVIDFKELNNNLNNIVGVIGTSLFTKEVTKIIIAKENEIQIISK